MAKRKAPTAKTAGKRVKKVAKKPARRAATKPKGAAKKSVRRSAATPRTGKPKAVRKTARKPATTRRAASKKTAPAHRKPATAVRKAAPAAVTMPKVSAAAPRATTGRRTPRAVTIPSPPSSLDMKRGGSSVRSGRAAAAESRAEQASLTPSITGGDVDTNVEAAYFDGDEAPGGSNPTPDQDVVDEIGKALGVEYQDAEELRGGDELAARDTHRWELDPASAEDYRERGKD